MEEPSTKSVEVEARVAAPPEVVFAYFVDPARYRRWMGQEAELDPRPGGVYRVRMADQNVARGEFVEVEPPNRVVFTWGWEGSDDIPPGSTIVEITLVPDGDETVVRLSHTGLPDDQSAAMHGEGWAHYLQRLTVAGAGRDPGPDRLGS
jgi:uncharacterized protein YndB with AHSA1/START domain